MGSFPRKFQCIFIRTENRSICHGVRGNYVMYELHVGRSLFAETIPIKKSN